MRTTPLRHIWLLALVLIAACEGGTLERETTTTTAPPPASAGELEVVCQRYAEVENEDFGAMLEALEEVAPAELHVHIVKVLNLDENWEENQRAVWEFLEQCEV